ncbi:Cell wall alpha-1,3-glucan synthase ags1 [Nowakowskiella sp. JEL0407]|nr:Cell wall alpha-1,3-glucan synthase ags1 [Nowakowskiella sp. JEL0407]
MLDRFADGDPTNNDIKGTSFEFDRNEVSLRFGGDVQGLISHLDYLQGLGIKGIYIAGAPLENLPWDSHQYSPIDATLLDQHLGTIEEWRSLVDEIHKRKMYIMLDVTVGTMADLLAFEGYENKSAPFDIHEHNVHYKSKIEYADFQFNNTFTADCKLPEFWNLDGKIQAIPISTGCFDSDFSQYGDVDAFGVIDPWQRSLGKFFGVQDRLRDWYPRVTQKLISIYCAMIQSLDIDAFRLDKGTQMTLEFLKTWSPKMRECAAKLGKSNFMVAGEAPNGADFNALYMGRGREPRHRLSEVAKAPIVSYYDDSAFLRKAGESVLDSIVFHYSVYRSFTRFAGLDGNLEAAYDLPLRPVQLWDEMLVRDDFINPSSMRFDPKHLFGVGNQDLFRWRSLVDGDKRLRMGLVLMTLVYPGAPVLYWGEETNIYLHDSRAENFIYGRQPMATSYAWQAHGCFKGNASVQYNQMPFGKIRKGCEDETQSHDHFDQTSPDYAFVKMLYSLRETYPILVDGFLLTEISNITTKVVLPGSRGVPSEFGLFTMSKKFMQNTPFYNAANAKDSVWFLFSNINETRVYTADCNSNNGILSSYPAGTVLVNILPPFDTITLANSAVAGQGCIGSISMEPYGFRAYTAQANVKPLKSYILSATPPHDSRVVRTSSIPQKQMKYQVSFTLSGKNQCAQLTDDISLASHSVPGQATSGSLNKQSVVCRDLTGAQSPPVTLSWWSPPATWVWTGSFESLSDGIHEILISGKTFEFDNSGVPTRYIFRIGDENNVMAFPKKIYSEKLLSVLNGEIGINHQTVVGADKFRVSLDYGKSWSNYTQWTPWTTIPSTILSQMDFSSAPLHVVVQYWSQATSSSVYELHSEVSPGFNIKSISASTTSLPVATESQARRFPNVFVCGKFNLYCGDKGIPGDMKFKRDMDGGSWVYGITAEFPSKIKFDVWGDFKWSYGDVDNDFILDRLPPTAQDDNSVYLPVPPSGYMGWTIILNDKNLTYKLVPRGSLAVSAIITIIIILAPLISGIAAVLIFRTKWYQIKVNKSGRIVELLGFTNQKLKQKLMRRGKGTTQAFLSATPATISDLMSKTQHAKRKILIATLEYEIFDWNIKVRIGGLGVIASIMGKHLESEIIWVIPKVGDIEYPEGEKGNGIEVTLLGRSYTIDVSYHKYNNIKYVILDAAIFKTRTKKNPYPERMDDAMSAAYYSAWNQAIAKVIVSENVDLYHMNDYHGTLAPLYLLPKVIPVALSLHNAEFQGLWSVDEKAERDQICKMFNVPKSVLKKYVQYGGVFNLLHAGVSYIRIHQHGEGVAGVSSRYGIRSYARYPILWGLRHVAALPNPNPLDFGESATSRASTTDDADARMVTREAIVSEQAKSKLELQKWTGLPESPDATILGFVGRWSKQKGVDLIADLTVEIFEKYPNVQMVCVGPVIDMYGAIAALKLLHLQKLYPTRMYVKPEFTALPSFIFSGCDFVMIPSRDEPFGLVAVEFGRQGALGIGSYVGGLGLMPGWWFPIESADVGHLQAQFFNAIKMALASTEEERITMRETARNQRFPVEEWLHTLDAIYEQATKASDSARKPGSSPNESDEDEIPEGEDDDNESAPSIAPSLTTIPDDDITNSNRLNTLLASWFKKTTQVISRSSSRENLSGMAVVNLPGMKRSSSHNNLSRNNSTVNLPRASSHDNLRRAASRETLNAEPVNIMGHGFGEGPSTQPGDSLGADIERRRQKSYASIDLDHEKIAQFNEFREENKLNFTFQQEEVRSKFEKEIEGVQLNAQACKTSHCVDLFIQRQEKRFYKTQEKEYTKELKSNLTEHDESDADSSNSAPVSKLVSVFGIVMQFNLLGWKVYVWIMVLGQILSTTAFQLVLLTGGQNNSQVDTYVIGGIYIFATALWFLGYHKFNSASIICIPYILWALSLLLMGISSFIQTVIIASWIQRISIWIYSIAASSYFLFFSLNFGEDVAAEADQLVKRAAYIEGVRQIWISVLWYWGTQVGQGATASGKAYLPVGAAVALFIISFVFIMFAVFLRLGLPQPYYVKSPRVPALFMSLLSRRLVIWHFVSEILRTYWLSASYGRNLGFLWNRTLNPGYIAALMLLFYVFIWGSIMYLFTQYSKKNSWFVPVFAAGLLTPRWAQMWWAFSNLSVYLPWAGTHDQSISVSIWLWLGVFDSVQMVGLGMMLLQTLTRIHMVVVLAIAQILGSLSFLFAYGTAPDRLGPGQVFTDVAIYESSKDDDTVAQPFFWIVLVVQIVIAFGYLFFFRKEQLSKP